MSKCRILKGTETVLFDMPFLESRPATDIMIDREVEERILAQNAETIEREAYERGFSAGERAGFEMGDHKAVILLNRLETIVTEITGLKESISREFEPQIMELALAIARKVVLDELTLRPEAVVEIVKEAIKKIERTGRITVKINPSLRTLFLRLKPQLLELHPDILYEIDPAVPITGPLVIGAREEVVTDIDVQLEGIAAQIEDEVGGS